MKNKPIQIESRDVHPSSSVEQAVSTSLLRQRAEEQFQRRPIPIENMPSPDLQRLVHELGVHQIELEMQNDELRKAWAETETALDLYDFAPMGYLTMEQNGTICRANLTAANEIGMQRHRLPGVRFGLFVAKNDLPVFNTFLTQIFLTREKQGCEIALQNNKNVSMWVMLEGIAREGEPDCRVVMVDITRRKEMEAQMGSTEKLASLGTLAAGIAHELNTPLQVITGQSDSLLGMLQKDGLDPKRLTRKVEDIKANAWRAAEIVRSLLTFAHVSNLQLEPHDLNKLIMDTLLLIEHQLKSWSNIFVYTDLGSDFPLFYCDRNQLTQVLINLLNNSRNAMPGGGKITIRTSFDPQTNRHIIEVADTGPGVPTAIREKIFDPFFTTQPAGHGTGLGLSIVTTIVKFYGGEITIGDASPSGAIFTICLPATGPNFPNPPVFPAVPGRY